MSFINSLERLEELQKQIQEQDKSISDFTNDELNKYCISRSDVNHNINHMINFALNNYKGNNPRICLICKAVNVAIAKKKARQRYLSKKEVLKEDNGIIYT